MIVLTLEGLDGPLVGLARIMWWATLSGLISLVVIWAWVSWLRMSERRAARRVREERRERLIESRRRNMIYSARRNILKRRRRGR